MAFQIHFIPSPSRARFSSSRALPSCHRLPCSHLHRRHQHHYHPSPGLPILAEPLPLHCSCPKPPAALALVPYGSVATTPGLSVPRVPTAVCLIPPTVSPGSAVQCLDLASLCHISMVRTRGGSRLRPRVRFSTPEREEQAPVQPPVP